MTIGSKAELGKTGLDELGTGTLSGEIEDVQFRESKWSGVYAKGRTFLAEQAAG